jgi:hypothetical protein
VAIKLKLKIDISFMTKNTDVFRFGSLISGKTFSALYNKIWAMVVFRDDKRLVEAP